MVPVRRAERDLLDGLVHHQPLGLLVDHAQPVAAHVQHRAHRPPPGILDSNRYNQIMFHRNLKE
jgi:hypothetical protein